jgi:flagellar biogenesis protein FliO
VLSYHLIFKVLGALLIVFAVMLAVLWLIKRYGGDVVLNKGGKLAVEEKLMLGSGKQAIVISYEEKKYLVVLGNQETIIPL